MELAAVRAINVGEHIDNGFFVAGLVGDKAIFTVARHGLAPLTGPGFLCHVGDAIAGNLQ